MKPFGALLSSVVLLACGGSIADPTDQQRAPSGAEDPSSLPASACAPLGPVTKRLVDLGTKEVRALVPDGERVVLGTYDRTVSSFPTAVLEVPSAGGDVVRVGIMADLAEPIDVVGRELVLVRSTKVGADTLASIVLFDRGTNAEREISPPADVRVSDVHASAAGPMWASSPRSGGRSGAGISLWDGTSAKPVVDLGSMAGGIVTDEAETFYVDAGRSGVGWTLEAAPLRGGPARVLRDYGRSINEGYRPIGTDADEVFVARSKPIGHGTFDVGDVRAVKKDGSGERIVVTIPSFDGYALLDPSYVTWPDTTRGAIVRFPLAGGPLERIDVAGRVSRIAIDRCNLYWSTSEPSALYGRSRVR